MRKFLSAAAVFLLTFALCGGVSGLALAAPGDAVVFADANLKAALVTAGVDANHDGSITEGEMASPSLTALSLPGKGIKDLTGIEYAVNLKSLDLTGNDLNGGGLASLWSLTGLESLDLKMNAITSLPDGIGSLVNLKELNLYENSLASLPAAIGNLTGLTDLVLHKNRLVTLPGSFANLVRLESLMLWDNYLISFPAGVFNGMNALRELDVAGNYLDPRAGSDDAAELNAARAKGAEVTDAPQRQYTLVLSLNGGSLVGSAPKTMYYHGETLVLPAASKAGLAFSGWDLDGDGAVDAEAGDKASVAPTPVSSASVTFRAIYGYTVTFSTQRFGTIDGGEDDITVVVRAGEHVDAVPVAAAREGYTLLGWFDGTTLVNAGDILAGAVNSNRCYTALYEADGTIHFTDSGFYAALRADGADPNGDAFITDAELAAVTELDLSGGHFSNMQYIGGASSLQTLKLGSAGLSALPDEIGNLTELRVLDISGNPVSSLPDEVFGLPKLHTLDISGCAFTAVPEPTEYPTTLKVFRMAGNRIRSLPALLLGNGAIEVLDLSGNLLTALTDDCFAGMTGLTSLDLSGNYLNPDDLPAGLPGFAVKSPQTAYTVTLDRLGGTGDDLPGGGLCYYGGSVLLPAASRAESDFSGWDADGDGDADFNGGDLALIAPNPPDSAAAVTFTAVYISKNARLSGVGLSAGAYILPAFDPDSNGCTITLYDYVGSVTITPQKANGKAEMRINGAEALSASIQLASSAESSVVTVDMTAEDGVTTRSYTLTVRRAAFVSLGLTKVALSPAVALSPKFALSVTSYTALLPATIGTVTVSAAKYSPSATVMFDGVKASSRAYTVGLGMTRTVKIVVSSPLTTDKTRTYTLTLKRATTLSSFAAVPRVGTYPTLSPGGSNRMTFSWKMNGPGAVKLEVYKSSRWIAVLSRAEASAGLKSWAWDGKVSGAYLAVGTYKVRITPTANGMAGTAATLTVKIVKVPVVTWKSCAATFRATGATLALCAFKVNYPTNAAVQVINSRGKVVAAVKSFTNLPPNVYYAVTWNGKATAGNTAGLAAGALAPAGTYTVRVTVGAKYYYKTIKITR